MDGGRLQWRGNGFVYLTPIIADGLTALTASSSLSASPSLESGYELGAPVMLQL